MANPYIGNSPYTSQIADIGYPQSQYQGSTQDTRMQDQFHSNALQQMQQLGVPQQTQQGDLSKQLALAKGLRALAGSGNQPTLTPEQTWNMTYGTQAQPYTGGATYGVDAAQNYQYWK